MPIFGLDEETTYTIYINLGLSTIILISLNYHYSMDVVLL